MQSSEEKEQMEKVTCNLLTTHSGIFMCLISTTTRPRQACHAWHFVTSPIDVHVAVVVAIIRSSSIWGVKCKEWIKEGVCKRYHVQ